MIKQFFPIVFLYVILFALFFNVKLSVSDVSPLDYQIGTGIYDVTGPAAESGMMGYAMVNQRTHGLHLRLRSRAFIMKHKATNTSFVYVNLDLCMTMQAVKLSVVKTLKEVYPSLGALYNEDNIALSATHTHSGPGGFSWYTLYDITTFGFEYENFKAIVNGIVESIARAHDSMSKGGRIYVSEGLLFDSNINRSPPAYLMNPPEEREKYKNVGDTDKLMTVLKMVDENNNPRGAIAWYAVHCTSMNNTNELISSDNKGYASYLFEKHMNNGSLPGTPGFVAAFAQSNEGDVSPNTKGPSCPDGSPCAEDSTCDGKNEGCIAKGPGKDIFESTKIIGTNQYKKAVELFVNAKKAVSGPIQFRHTFVDMTSVQVKPDYTSTKKAENTCRPAMGYSFAAGTTDGPGDFDFRQGDNNTQGNPFWNFIGSFIAEPTEEQKKCQFPKPILFDVGEAKPYSWVPTILPLQMMTIGDEFVMINVPGEFTTMSGRRLRERIKSTLMNYNHANVNTSVVISGLANAYSSYVATYEEYIMQRYEAASTLYGPHTLSAYIQEFDKLAMAIGENKPVPSGPTPMNLSSHQISFNPGVVMDTHPIGKPFGSIHIDAKETYQKGDTVFVEFWAGHPKNSFQTEKTYLSVERQIDGRWQVMYTDGDWDTKFRWRRHFIAESIATVEWTIADDVQAGNYRIRHFGSSKNIIGDITPYEGQSSVFKVY